MSSLKKDDDVKLFDEEEIRKIPLSDDVNDVKVLKKMKIKYKIWVVDNVKYAVFNVDN